MKSRIKVVESWQTMKTRPTWVVATVVNGTTYYATSTGWQDYIGGNVIRFLAPEEAQRVAEELRADEARVTPLPLDD